MKALVFKWYQSKLVDKDQNASFLLVCQFVPRSQQLTWLQCYSHWHDWEPSLRNEILVVINWHHLWRTTVPAMRTQANCVWCLRLYKQNQGKYLNIVRWWMHGRNFENKRQNRRRVRGNVKEHGDKETKERNIVKHRGERPRNREVHVREWEKTMQKRGRDGEKTCDTERVRRGWWMWLCSCLQTLQHLSSSSSNAVL